MKHFCFKLKAGGLAILMTMVPSVPADDSHTVSGDRATDRVVDVLAVRPMGLATTAIGAVLTVVALPFTLPSGSVKDSARMMVVNPA
ncbi:MAG: hypothetical protein HXY27_07800 [Hydrogenophilaceae bacterium]|nr:hypothetical protein [Hydrogenophilaceae bacterium]